jgi:very-short-patch-repair endonuclease
VDHRGGVQRDLESLIASQFGVVSREQALARGISRRMIERRLDSGHWVPMHRSVYRVAVVPRSLAQRAMAVSLWSAPDGLVSHETAATLWGLEGIATNDLHVLVPRARHMRSETVRVHRTSDLLPADRAMKQGIAITSPLRTVIDLAGGVDAAALETLIESGLRRRLFSPGQLRWRAEALMGTGRTGSATLRALLASRELDRSESAWEVRVAGILEHAGLGTPRRQYEVRGGARLVARVDLAYPDARVAIEYDSDSWHTGVRRRHRDAERRNRLRAAGWTVIEVTAAQVHDPPGLVGLVRAVLAA